MGLVSLPEIRSHFSQSHEIYISPMVTQLISRDQFFSIFAHIHVDVEGDEPLEEEEVEEGSAVEAAEIQSEHDENESSDESEGNEGNEEEITNVVSPRTHNLGPERIATLFCSHLRSLYEHSSELCIDEIVTMFTGRFKGRVYIPSKPEPEGIEFFLCCDRNLIPLSIMIFHGETLTMEDRVLGLLASAISNFSRPLSLCVDRRFGTISLAKALDLKGISFCLGLKGNLVPKWTKYELTNQLHYGAWRTKESGKIRLFAFRDHKKSFFDVFSFDQLLQQQ